MELLGGLRERMTVFGVTLSGEIQELLLLLETQKLSYYGDPLLAG